jgi:2-amino-4-hydroxy-6-hydroxymethyldihydropteridine diphosphokinase
MSAVTHGTLACVGLGANLGDAHATLAAAIDELSRLPHTVMGGVSPTYRSAPIDATGPDYLNAVVALRTDLMPLALLAQLQRIEHDHGRERSVRNAPRTLDLDLLLYGEQSIDSPELTVPHPRLHQRAFVLLPLADLLPAAVIPGIGPIAQCLPAVADQRIERISP